jgi:hypothetical protein
MRLMWRDPALHGALTLVSGSLGVSYLWAGPLAKPSSALGAMLVRLPLSGSDSCSGWFCPHFGEGLSQVRGAHLASVPALFTALFCVGFELMASFLLGRHCTT